MIRRRSKIVVTDSWFLAAAGNVAEKSCAICSNCDNKNTTLMTFVEKPTNGEGLQKDVSQMAQLPTNTNGVEKDVAQMAQSLTLRQLRQSSSSSLPVKGGVKERDIRDTGAVGAIKNPAGVCPNCLGPQPDAADVSPAGAGHCRECWVTWGRAIPLHRGAAA